MLRAQLCCLKRSLRMIYRVVISLILATTLVVIFQRSQTTPHSHVTTQLAPQTFYAASVDGNRAVFDLPQCSDDYLLIVSDLSVSGPHSVSLSTETISRVTMRTDRPLECADCRPLQFKGSDQPLCNRQSESDAHGIKTNGITAARHFDLHVYGSDTKNADEYVRIAAYPLAQSPRVIIYLDEQQKPDNSIKSLSQAIIDLLENELLDPIQADLGEIRDVDQNGRLVVFLTPWLNRLQAGKTSLQGFVRRADFIDSANAPFSNRCDMLYINSSVEESSLPALLAHELTHGVCCSRAVSIRDDWLNEGIAHLAEATYSKDWSNLDHRVSEFLEHPAHFPLVVPDYYAAGMWRNHGCRGAAFLFLNWCRNQHPALLPELVNSPQTDFACVEKLLSQSFSELYRGWTMSLARESFWSTPEQGSPLCSPLGRFGLAGIRTINIGEQNSTATTNIHSTASAYYRVNPADKPQRIRVVAEYGAVLQITACRIPKRPNLQFKTSWESSGLMVHSSPAQATSNNRVHDVLWVAAEESKSGNQRLSRVKRGNFEPLFTAFPGDQEMRVKGIATDGKWLFGFHQDIPAATFRPLQTADLPDDELRTK